MNNSAPSGWTVTEAPVGHPDAMVLRRAYAEELIRRYCDRPAAESEIVEVVGDGSDVSEPQGVFLVARDGELPVGCVGMRWLDGGVAELTRVFVRVEARRGGGGTTLVGAAEEVARARGVSRMLLNTRKDLVEAIALYGRLGYRATEPYGDDPYAEVWLSKDLVQGCPAQPPAQ
ncbi:GNAT family N-acetyltransferase [Kitasatospora sp. GP82]|uniref:GNAT family N-acetyltransferase n=1 Tax=Kitasatospora sp. GP82 TaxID=3035089 RepID=UPI002474DCDD|nr:GNAT family N-acetyltransferase [Kitasatospora sp. GP82]